MKKMFLIWILMIISCVVFSQEENGQEAIEDVADKKESFLLKIEEAKRRNEELKSEQVDNQEN